nr:MAG TPA: chitin synthase regulator [Caudoviricetes sp.]
MSIISWLIFCVFVLIMGVIDLTLCIIDREERRKEDKKDE